MTGRKPDELPAPCSHEPKHEHGTDGAYRADRCRCRRCRDQQARAAAKRYRLKTYGQFVGLVDPARARAHLAQLRAAGMGLREIATATGMPRRHLGRVGQVAKIKPSTEARILAVNVKLAAGTPIDSTGTRRRVQALVANGWSLKSLTRECGHSTDSTLRAVLRSTKCSGITARQVAEMYDRLWNVAPRADNRGSRCSVTHSRSRARAAGWVPPLAWDDDEIDDPQARPHRSRADEIIRTADLIEDVELLLSTGVTDVEVIARRLGATVSALDIRLRRAGRTDLARPFNRQAVRKRKAA